VSGPAPIGDAPEIIGLGALNVDYIASASRLSQRLADRVTESTARFEWNKEGPVDRQTIVRAIENLGVASLSYSLGGSAWLTIFALAQMQVGLRLGYVGVVGRVEAPGLSFIGQMEDLGIDHRWVGQHLNRSCGLCLSYIDDTDRVMLTHPGANFEMCHHIRQNFDHLAAYLASARYVHVTSFLDDETPTEVRRVLTRAKELNRDLRISFDPGFDWAEHASPEVEGILALTNLLFVNYREFKALGGHTPGDADSTVARRVLSRCAAAATVFVTKRYDFIEAFQSTSDGVLTHRFQRGRPLRETELEDATGAGDVFAAAVLSSLTARRLQVELGAFVGLCLARHKMRFRKPRDYQTLPDLSQGFLQQTEAPPETDLLPKGVFIVHDGDPQRHVVRQFIERDCGLATCELSTVEIGEADPAEAILQNLIPRSLSWNACSGEKV
jgi:sugar/nucleoside kinase (ribokinase family)